MKAIVSAASGRSVSSSTTRASGVSRGGGAAAGVGRQRLAGCAEGDDAAPGRGLLLELARPGRAAGSARRPRRARRARPARRSAAAAVGQREAAPLPLRGEGDLGARPAPASPGKRSAIVSRVRLRSPALAAKRPSAAAPTAGSTPSANSTPASRSSPSVRVPVLSTQIVSTAARLSVALICWTRVSRCASRTAATAKVTLISSTRPSGISVTRPAVAVCAASSRSTLRSLRLRISRIAASGSIT